MYTLQTRKTGALASEMAASATSCTLAAATFGSPTGQQIITIDGGDILKAADFKCTITGTAITSMTLLNGVNVVHAAAAPVTMNFVDEHYSALTAFVGASAYLSSTLETTVSGAYTKVALNAETYDVGTNFASNKFVAPVSGYYSINAQVGYNAIEVNKLYRCNIYKNNAIRVRATLPNAVEGSSISVSCNKDEYLDKDDYLELFYYHTGATTTDISGGAEDTFMTVTLIKEV